MRSISTKRKHLLFNCLTAALMLFGAFVPVFSSLRAQAPCQYPPVPAPDPLPAQLWAGADNTFYAIGETISFRVRSNTDGPCTFTIREDRFLPVLQSGVLNLTADVESIVTYSIDRPTFLVFTVNQGGPDVTAGVAVDACAIEPIAFLPNDFDAFWDSIKAELAAVPINPQLTMSTVHSNQAQTTYKMMLDNIDGKKVYGWISIPNCPGPFSAILSLPSFGNFPIGPNTFDAQDGAIGVAISIHDYDCEQTVPDTIAYYPFDHFLHRNTNYYKTAVTACLRAVDYIFTRPEFDGVHMAVTGVSQGGGLSLMTAGLDPRVKYVAQGVTALCNHAAYASGRSSGFPYWVRTGVEQLGADAQDVVRETGYYDVVHFAGRYQGPSYNFVGYNDDICPPASVFAAYNQLTGKKSMFHSITTGHGNPPNFWPDRAAFWVEQGMPFSKFFDGCPPVPPADVVPPAQVGDLKLVYASYDSLMFSFQAPGDDGNDGVAYRYEIRYSTDTITDATFNDAKPLNPKMFPLMPGTIQQFVLMGLDSGTTYFFGIRALDEADNAGPAAVVKGTATAFTETCLANGITFTTQKEIDDFQLNYPGCRTIQGDVFIEDLPDGGIRHLTGLLPVEAILGGLTIRRNPALADLSGLDNLKHIGGSLGIASNDSLMDIEALSRLNFIGDNLFFEDNDSLRNFSGLENINTINGSLLIYTERSLTSLQGLNNVDTVHGCLEIWANQRLANLDELANLKHIGLCLDVRVNSSLTDLDGLANIRSVPGFLRIDRNDALLNLDGLNNLDSIGGRLTISDNASLLDVKALENLQSINGLLDVFNNDALTSLEGLDNIRYQTISDLRIGDCNQLSVCHVQSVCDYLENSAVGSASIGGNAAGCATRVEVETSCMSTGVQLDEESGIAVFPNPFQRTLNVTGWMEGFWIVTDLLGRPVRSDYFTGAPLDLSLLPEGMYVLRLYTDKGVMAWAICKADNGG